MNPSDPEDAKGVATRQSSSECLNFVGKGTRLLDAGKWRLLLLGKLKGYLYVGVISGHERFGYDIKHRYIMCFFTVHVVVTHHVIHLNSFFYVSNL